jgi:hypothetical protein
MVPRRRQNGQRDDGGWPCEGEQLVELERGERDRSRVNTNEGTAAQIITISHESPYLSEPSPTQSCNMVDIVGGWIALR